MPFLYFAGAALGAALPHTKQEDAVIGEVGDKVRVKAAEVAFVAASLLFSWYSANFANYEKTYGSLGAFIGFFTWMWISVMVVLVGAELNSEIEHQTAEDSTIGMDTPIGARNATVADTMVSPPLKAETPQITKPAPTGGRATPLLDQGTAWAVP